jgi:hypothetical protein
MQDRTGGAGNLNTLVKMLYRTPKTSIPGQEMPKNLQKPWGIVGENLQKPDLGQVLTKKIEVWTTF